MVTLAEAELGARAAMHIEAADNPAGMTARYLTAAELPESVPGAKEPSDAEKREEDDGLGIETTDEGC